MIWIGGVGTRSVGGVRHLNPEIFVLFLAVAAELCLTALVNPSATVSMKKNTVSELNFWKMSCNENVKNYFWQKHVAKGHVSKLDNQAAVHGHVLESFVKGAIVATTRSSSHAGRRRSALHGEMLSVTEDYVLTPDDQAVHRCTLASFVKGAVTASCPSTVACCSLRVATAQSGKQSITEVHVATPDIRKVT